MSPWRTPRAAREEAGSARSLWVPGVGGWGAVHTGDWPRGGTEAAGRQHRRSAALHATLHPTSRGLRAARHALVLVLRLGCEHAGVA